MNDDLEFLYEDQLLRFDFSVVVVVVVFFFLGGEEGGGGRGLFFFQDHPDDGRGAILVNIVQYENLPDIFFFPNNLI